MARTRSVGTFLAGLAIGLVLGWVGGGLAPGAPAGGTAGDPSATATAAPIAASRPADLDLGSVPLTELPDEAHDTIELIGAGGPFPFRQDGSVFENREGLLPDRPAGHYREYTVPRPGNNGRGVLRIVAGADGELYWTPDHYDSFVWIER